MAFESLALPCALFAAAPEETDLPPDPSACFPKTRNCSRRTPKNNLHIFVEMPSQALRSLGLETRHAMKADLELDFGTESVGAVPVTLSGW
jgi:hypothetical protein